MRSRQQGSEPGRREIEDVAVALLSRGGAGLVRNESCKDAGALEEALAGGGARPLWPKATQSACCPLSFSLLLMLSSLVDVRFLRRARSVRVCGAEERDLSFGGNETGESCGRGAPSCVAEDTSDSVLSFRRNWDGGGRSTWRVYFRAAQIERGAGVSRSERREREFRAQMGRTHRTAWCEPSRASV